MKTRGLCGLPAEVKKAGLVTRRTQTTTERKSKKNGQEKLTVLHREIGHGNLRRWVGTVSQKTTNWRENCHSESGVETAWA